MGQRISKKEIKSYIEFLESDLYRREKEGIKMQAINDKDDKKIYDMKEHYLKEEHIRGQIEAAKYILKCC